MITESLMDPPAFFSTLISSISTLYFSPSFSETAITDFTIISASKSESFLTNLVCIEVFAIFVNMFLSIGEMESAISSRYSLTFLADFLYPSTIIVGCTF